MMCRGSVTDTVRTIKIYKIVTMVKIGLGSQFVTSECPVPKRMVIIHMFLHNTVIQRITEIYQDVELCCEPNTITTEWVTNNPDNPSGHQQFRDKIPAYRWNRINPQHVFLRSGSKAVGPMS